MAASALQLHLLYDHRVCRVHDVACILCGAGPSLRYQTMVSLHAKFEWPVQINDAQEAIQEGTEGAKDAIQDAADKVGDAVKKVTGQD